MQELNMLPMQMENARRAPQLSGTPICNRLGATLACLARIEPHRCLPALLFLLMASYAVAQSPTAANDPPPDSQLKVNWLYGAYVDKYAPLVSLTANQRLKLFLRQSFTTPGVYVKTALFSIGDQIDNSPPSWGTGFGGLARRAGSRHGQFVIQNSLTALGNGLLGFEPRYNRCQCSGFWNRTRHAVVRNFVTYDRTETAIRPQIALYAGAFGAGVISGTWKPTNRDLIAEGYRSAITQAAFGIFAHWVGEFAPDIKRVLRKEKSGTR